MRAVSLKLVDAAFASISEHGYDDTNVISIARSAGVDRSTFYRYFESKEDIVYNGCLRFVLDLNSASASHGLVVHPLEADVWSVFGHVRTRYQFYQQMDQSAAGPSFWNHFLSSVDELCFARAPAPTRSECYLRVAFSGILIGYLHWWLRHRDHVDLNTAYTGSVYALRGIVAQFPGARI